jgi:hypothetical protein
LRDGASEVEMCEILVFFDEAYASQGAGAIGVYGSEIGVYGLE